MQGQMISYESTLKKAAKVESEAICVLHLLPLLFMMNSFSLTPNLIYHPQVVGRKRLLKD